MELETVIIITIQLLDIVDATGEFHSVFASHFSESGLHLADLEKRLTNTEWNSPVTSTMPSNWIGRITTVYVAIP